MVGSLAVLSKVCWSCKNAVPHITTWKTKINTLEPCCGFISLPLAWLIRKDVSWHFYKPQSTALFNCLFSLQPLKLSQGPIRAVSFSVLVTVFVSKMKCHRISRPGLFPLSTLLNPKTGAIFNESRKRYWVSAFMLSSYLRCALVQCMCFTTIESLQIYSEHWQLWCSSLGITNLGTSAAKRNCHGHDLHTSQLFC